MKKIILLTLILIASSQFAFSQQAIAKIKYEEAEEAFSTNDFKTTVLKLDEAETLLKATNPRIMYLKILAQSKIIEKEPLNDYKILENTRQLCAKYLLEYESIPNNEDKYRDVYNVTEGLKKNPKSETEFAAKINLLDNLPKNAQKYMYGKGTIDYKLAYNAYKELADLGDAIGDNGLGNLYLHGWAVEKNLEKAKSLFELSASKGNLNGQVSMGWFLKLQGVDEIEDRYMKQYRENIPYSEKLMFKLRDEEDLEKTEINNRAEEYYKLASIQGNNVKYALEPKTLFFFGSIYGSGKYGYNKDANKAKEYLLLFIDNDDDEIQYEVGIIFFYGKYIDEDNRQQDYVQAAKYFRLAYLNGKDNHILERSSSMLSILYKDGGYGIEKDKKEAKLWSNKSWETYKLMHNIK